MGAGFLNLDGFFLVFLLRAGGVCGGVGMMVFGIAVSDGFVVCHGGKCSNSVP